MQALLVVLEFLELCAIEPFFEEAAVEDVQEGLTLLEFDSRVRCIVVTTYAGIFENMSLVKALIGLRKQGLQTKPVVLRLRGYHEQEARELLEEHQQEEIKKTGKSSLYICTHMDQAAKLAVKVGME